MAGAGTVLELRRPVDAGPASLVWTARASGEVLARVELDGRPLPPCFAEDLPAVPARARMADLLEMRALLDQGRRRCRLDTLALVDGEGKTTVRVVVDRPLHAPAAEGDDGDDPDEGAEPVVLEVVPVRGYDAAWARVVEVLDAQVVLQPLVEDAATRARRAVTDVALPVVAAAPGARPDVVGGRGVAGRGPGAHRHHGRQPRGHPRRHRHRVPPRLPGRRAPDALGAAPRAGASCPRAPAADFREEFRWLGDVTTPTRDADVHLLDLPGLLAALPEDRAAQLGPLRAAARRAAGRLPGAARRRPPLAPRTRPLREGWQAFLDDAAAWPGPPTDERRAAAIPTAPDAARPARERGRRHASPGPTAGCVRDGRLIDDASPAGGAPRPPQGRQAAALPARVLRLAAPDRRRRPPR